MTREEALEKIREIHDLAVSELGAPPLDDESGLILFAVILQETMYECLRDEPERLLAADQGWKKIWNALGFVTGDQLDPPMAARH